MFDPFGDEEVAKWDFGNQTSITGPSSRPGTGKSRHGSLTQQQHRAAAESALGRKMEIPGAGLAAGESGALGGDEETRKLAEEKDVGMIEEDDKDENIYPKPLGLFLLVTGIALSVFLISLDRTIITTVSLTKFRLNFAKFERTLAD